MRQRNDLAAFISTVWQIVPNDVPCSVLASSICWLIAPRILETFTVAAGLEVIIVDIYSFVQVEPRLNADARGQGSACCINEGRTGVFSRFVISWSYFPWNVNLGNCSSWLVTWRFCVTREEPELLTDIRDSKISGFAAEFAGCVRTETVSGKKKLRI